MTLSRFVDIRQSFEINNRQKCVTSILLTELDAIKKYSSSLTYSERDCYQLINAKLCSKIRFKYCSVCCILNLNAKTLIRVLIQILIYSAFNFFSINQCFVIGKLFAQPASKTLSWSMIRKLLPIPWPMHPYVVYLQTYRTISHYKIKIIHTRPKGCE